MAAAKPKKPATKRSAIHVVAGNDEMAVKNRAKELAAELSPAEGGDFAVETIDGNADNVDQACAAIRETILSLSMPGFLSAEKLVWLKSVNFLSDTQLGGSKTVLEALEELHGVLTAGWPDGTRLLISAVSPDKRRTFYKSLAKLGQTEVLDKPSGFGIDENALAERGAVSAARERGRRFAPDALARFVAYVGSDSRQIANEVEKLDVYLGGEKRDIGEDDVRELVPVTRKGIIFELGNCLARRDLRAASACLQRLLAQDEEPIGILYAAIVPTVRNLLASAILARDHGVRAGDSYAAYQSALNGLPAEAAEIVPKKKDGTVNAYGLFVTAKEARRYSVEELSGATIACADAAASIMSTGSDPALVLQQLLVRMLTPK